MNIKSVHNNNSVCDRLAWLYVKGPLRRLLFFCFLVLFGLVLLVTLDYAAYSSVEKIKASTSDTFQEFFIFFLLFFFLIASFVAALVGCIFLWSFLSDIYALLTINSANHFKNTLTRLDDTFLYLIATDTQLPDDFKVKLSEYMVSDCILTGRALVKFALRYDKNAGNPRKRKANGRRLLATYSVRK